MRTRVEHGVRRVAVFAAAVVFLAPAVMHGAAEIGPGYVASGNVRWLANIPVHAGASGARILGSTLYITDVRGLYTYDISTPELPLPLGFLPLPQQSAAFGIVIPDGLLGPFLYAQEDVDTNGRVLAVSTNDVLFVIDVSDPRLPRIVHVGGAGAHTISCVMDCSYLWYSAGEIVDLHDPTRPAFRGNWHAELPAGLKGVSAHDVTEVSPGLIVTSSNPVLLLDARESPLRPKLLATGIPGDGRFIHANIWPRGGTDRWLLVGGESPGSCRHPQAGAFMTFDTLGWETTGRVHLVDQYRVQMGLPTEGNSTYDGWCAHWFTPRPGWNDGGIVAMSWYQHGTRFLDVSSTGDVSEIGFFLPVGSVASAAYWVTDEIVYVVDYHRGLDVIRFAA